MSLTIDITVESQLWNAHESRLRPLIEAAVKAALDGAEIEYDNAEISVVLCDDAFIRNLNRDYRAKDKATNVLSFPQYEDEDMPTAEPVCFGDVILAYETIEREAEEQEKAFDDHFTHLIVHGTLHLLGYDHETDEEAAEMESLEISVLRTIGIENPYTDKSFVA